MDRKLQLALNERLISKADKLQIECLETSSADLMNDSINILNPREKEILTARRLSEDIPTLEDLSKKYKISRERIRQIETKAFEKLQKAILAAAKADNLLQKN